MPQKTWNDDWWGGKITDCISCIVEDNASPYTFNGSSTWIIDSTDGASCVVVDPGPDAAHSIEELASTCMHEHGKVRAILGTHKHLDHIGGAAHLADIVGAPLLIAEDGSLKEGPIDIPGFDRKIVCVPIPGHSSDSVAFWMPNESALFIGDTCFNGSSSLVEYPDGNLSQYIDSLNRLIALIEEHDIQHVLPGHKGPMENAAWQLHQVVNARLRRVDEIVALCEAGTPFDIDVLVKEVYGDLKPGLAYAVRITTLSTMQYIIEHGLLPGIADPAALDVPRIA